MLHTSHDVIHSSRTNRKTKLKNEMTEFYDLGAHCSLPDCRQQDFLPFNCAYCHQVYCLDHRTPDCHKCTKYEEEIQKMNSQRSHHNHHAGKQKKVKTAKCKLVNCSENAITTCKICELKFCITHRHEMDHNCEKPKHKKAANKKKPNSQKPSHSKQPQIAPNTLLLQLTTTLKSNASMKKRFDKSMTMKQVVDEFVKREGISLRNQLHLLTSNSVVLDLSKTLHQLENAGLVKSGDQLTLQAQPAKRTTTGPIDLKSLHQSRESRQRTQQQNNGVSNHHHQQTSSNDDSHRKGSSCRLM